MGVHPPRRSFRTHCVRTPDGTRKREREMRSATIRSVLGGMEPSAPHARRLIRTLEHPRRVNSAALALIARCNFSRKLRLFPYGAQHLIPMPTTPRKSSSSARPISRARAAPTSPRMRVAPLRAAADIRAARAAGSRPRVTRISFVLSSRHDATTPRAAHRRIVDGETPAAVAASRTLRPRFFTCPGRPCASRRPWLRASSRLARPRRE